MVSLHPLTDMNLLSTIFTTALAWTFWQTLIEVLQLIAIFLATQIVCITRMRENILGLVFELQPFDLL